MKAVDKDGDGEISKEEFVTHAFESDVIRNILWDKINKLHVDRGRSYQQNRYLILIIILLLRAFFSLKGKTIQRSEKIDICPSCLSSDVRGGQSNI